MAFAGEEVAKLVKDYDEETLVEQLGARAKAIPEDPAVAGRYNPTITVDYATMGPMDDIVDLGGRILRRWERELHAVVCGDAKADKQDRTTILDALGLDDVALGAALGTVLVTSFGLAPAIATVVAALLIKRIFKPAGDEVCTFWGERLEAR